MGRPSKLNEELIAKMYDEIAEGLPVSYTCDLFGISQVSFSNWMIQGKKDSEEENEDSIYYAFFVAIKKAQAIFVKKIGQEIRKGEQGWQGKAWWLERTRQDFMPKQQIQADDEGKVTVVIGGKPKYDNNK